jgi:hypothetical protein
MSDYKVPGSYVEEVAIPNVGISSATAATLFVGALAAGPSSLQQVESWSDFVTIYGAPTGFEDVPDPANTAGSATGKVKTFLGYEVYSYFRNGGRPALIQRATGTGLGTAATAALFGNGFTGSPAVVTNVARASDVATLTTAAAHGFVAGNVVNVAGVTNSSNAFNKAGAIVLSAPTTTTFTYTTDTTGTVPSAAATGTTPQAGKPDKVIQVKAKSATQAANYVAGGSAIDKGMVIEATLTGTTTGDGTPLFNISVYKGGIAVETYKGLTLNGSDGTRKPTDALRNSSEVDVLVSNEAGTPVTTPYPAGAFSTGTDPDLPTATNLHTAATAAVSVITDPVIVTVAGYVNSLLTSDRDTFISTTMSSSDFGNREDVFIINDNAQQHEDGTSSAVYANLIDTTETLSPNSSDSYVASYTPWVTVVDPTTNNGRITIPPAGSVAGVMSRIDGSIGVFRTPAGVVANLVDALDVDVQFTQSQLGTLNDHHINVIRPIAGQGICVMGGRTRKAYGIDKYVAARRTLIFTKESLRRSTQYAVFEDNDQRLWSNLIVTAESILRPLWEAGGLKGASAQEAYFIQCDQAINTPSVVEAGEVHMNVGVALQSPAEFIVIRVAQSQGGTSTTEIL